MDRRGFVRGAREFCNGCCCRVIEEVGMGWSRGLGLTLSLLVGVSAMGAQTGAGLAPLVTKAPAGKWAIVMHGGAGVIERSTMKPETERQYRAGLDAAIHGGGKGAGRRRTRDGRDRGGAEGAGGGPAVQLRAWRGVCGGRDEPAGRGDHGREDDEGGGGGGCDDDASSDLAGAGGDGEVART